MVREMSTYGYVIYIQGVLGLHKFWAREKIVQAKFVLVKLCTCPFVKLRASEILSTCYRRIWVYLKIRASEIRTSEIRASQGPPVYPKVTSQEYKNTSISSIYFFFFFFNTRRQITLSTSLSDTLYLKSLLLY